MLENSAALATITMNLTAPGAPVVVRLRSKRGPRDAATTAWRYLRHNSLAVLDGLAVGGGWALPVLVLLGLVGPGRLAGRPAPPAGGQSGADPSLRTVRVVCAPGPGTADRATTTTSRAAVLPSTTLSRGVDGHRQSRRVT